MRYQAGKILELKKDYEQKAINDGSRQIPQLESESDHNENELQLTAKEHLRSVELYHNKLIQDKKEELAKTQMSWMEEQTTNAFQKNMEDELGSLNNNLEARYREHKTHLEDIGSKVIVSNSEINTFRVVNKLTRQAKYPISYKKSIAIMASIVIGESVINAYSHQGEGGLIDGAGVALFISAINVAIAAFLGRWFTRKNHILTFNKVIGWSAFILFLVSSIYLNSLYATFRTELHKILDEEAILAETNVPESGTAVAANTHAELTPEELAENKEAKVNPTKVAFIRALKKAWHVFALEVPFKDLLSYLTFFLTLIFSVIAFYEGYHLNDPYPGYGNLDKDNVKAKHDYDDAWKLFSIELGAEPIKSQAEYENKVQRLAFASPAAILQLATHLENKKRDLENDLVVLNNEIEAVASHYRSLNIQTRGDGRIPKVYKDPVAKLAIQDDLKREYSSAIDQIKSYTDSYKKEYEQMFMKLNLEKEEFKKRSNKLFEEKMSEFVERTDKASRIAAQQIAATDAKVIERKA